MPRRLRLLYVEDDQLDATMLVRSFQRYHPDPLRVIDIAETVSDAILILEQTRYDAFLLDWNLTDGTAADVAGHIRATDATTPIIFLSGAWLDEQIREAECFAAAGCLPKTYNQKQIEQIYQLIS